jgi:hypothetical protein
MKEAIKINRKTNLWGADANAIHQAIALISKMPKNKIMGFIQCPKCQGVMDYRITASMTIFGECKTKNCIRFVR